MDELSIKINFTFVEASIMPIFLSNNPHIKIDFLPLDPTASLENKTILFAVSTSLINPLSACTHTNNPSFLSYPILCSHWHFELNDNSKYIGIRHPFLKGSFIFIVLIDILFEYFHHW